MKRVMVVCEGPTEAQFVKEIIAPHLAQYQVQALRTIVQTKFDRKRGKRYTGGGVTYGLLERNVSIQLQNDKGAFVTTFIDFYRLYKGFPGFDSMPVGDCYEQVQHLEVAFAKKISNRRFIPHLSLHEFETLLFSDLEQLDQILFQKTKLFELQQLLQIYGSPEKINTDPDTHPAAQLLRLFPTYRKRGDGLKISLAIGLEKIRVACPHFNNWITQLENL